LNRECNGERDELFRFLVERALLHRRRVPVEKKIEQFGIRLRDLAEPREILGHVVTRHASLSCDRRWTDRPIRRAEAREKFSRQRVERQALACRRRAEARRYTKQNRNHEWCRCRARPAARSNS